jgi:hypothetical protein
LLVGLTERHRSLRVGSFSSIILSDQPWDRESQSTRKTPAT